MSENFSHTPTPYLTHLTTPTTILHAGPLSDYEQQALEELKPVLKGNIDKGVAFVQPSESAVGAA